MRVILGRIAEWFIGHINLARWRLQVFFSGLNRAKVAAIVITAVVIIIGSSQITRIDFRANDDPIETPHFDYVSNQTKEIFTNKLNDVAEKYLTDNEKIEIIAQLSSQQYFDILSSQGRSDLVRSWDAPASWREQVSQIEQASDGSLAWLVWLEPYCEDGERGARNGGLVDVAHAQLSTQCLSYALSEAKQKDLEKWYSQLTIDDYLLHWRNFFGRAATATGCRNTPSDPGVPRERLFIKGCWASSDFDFLYSKYWPDLASRKNQPSFSPTEIKRILQVDKLNQAVIGNEQELALKELIKLELEIITWAIPVEKVVAIPLKIGGRALEALAASRVAAPWAYGVAVQGARLSGRTIELVSTFNTRITLEVGKVFAQSSRFTTSAKMLANQTLNDWKIDVLYQANAAANDVITKLGLPEVKRRQIEQKLFMEILPNTKVVSSLQMKRAYGGLLSREGAAYGLAIRTGTKTLLNEDALYFALKKQGWTREQIRSAIRNTWAHEFNHHLSSEAIRAFPYSKVLRYNPLEEGFTDYFAQKFVATTLPNAYTNEVDIVSEMYQMFIRRKQSEGFDPARATIEATNFFEHYYYEGSTAELFNFDYYIRQGLPKNHWLLSEVPANGSNPVIMKWITKKLEEDKLQGGSSGFNRIISMFEDTY